MLRMNECCYSNETIPAAPTFVAQAADASNASTGAQGAPSAQEGISSALSGAVAQPTLRKPTGGRSCRCWWVALAVVALVVVATR